MSRAAVAYDSDAAHSSKSRTSTLRVNKPGDAYEVEADRVAETVSNGGRLGSSHTGWSISKLDMGYVQRDSPDTSASAGVSVVPKPNNYAEGLGKIGEAFLKTDLGKQIADAAQKDPLVKGAESFVDSLPGKIILGAAAAGTVTALAAEHKALPAQLPAIPLDRVKPGLSVKITYQGPVDKPTQATISFSYTPKSATDEKKQKQAASERQHSAWARDAADLRQFQEGLKSPEQKQQEAEDAQHALDAWVTRPGANTLSGGIDTGRFLPKAQDKPAGPQLIVPSAVGPQRKPPSLLDKKLELAPIAGPLATADTAKPNADAKKKEEIPVQRRAEPSATIYADSADVEAVIHSSGRPLDPATRRSMESRIGFDFSKVRVHTDARAADSARSLGARAYTVGNHVVFGAGKFAPESSAGRRLLAHELTHVVQQSQDIGRKPSAIHAAPKQIQREGEEEGQESGGWFTNPIEKIKGFIRKVPGYKLFRVILGKDPISGEQVERNATNLLGAIFNLVPGGDAIFKRVEESGALDKAYNWVTQQIDALGLHWAYFTGLLDEALHSINWRDFADPKAALDRILDMFKPAWEKVKAFASAAADKVLEFAMEAALALIGGTGILDTLREAGQAFRTIVKDPVGFLKNLVEALKQGFNQFKDHILDHLKNSVLDLLFGAVAKTGIKLPKSFSLGDIVNLILQVLGLTYENFREKMVNVLGEGAVSFLESSFDFLIKLAQAKSLAGAWKMILAKADQLIESVLEGVKGWVVNKVVTIAIVKLAALFNPVGAIVEAIQTIYKTVNFFIEKAKQLKALLDAVVKSISNIAAGRLTDAANYVENAMANGMTAIVAFLAEQFGLGDIGKQVKAIIDAVRARVNKAVDGIIDYIVAKGKAFYEKGKESAGKVLQWWKQKKDVLIGDEEHSIYMDGTEESPKLLIASTPGVAWTEYLDARDKSMPKNTPKKQKDLLKETRKLAGELEQQLSPSSTPEEKSANVEKKRKLFNEVAKNIVALGFAKKANPASVIKYAEPRASDGGGIKATASILSSDHPPGTKPSDEPPIWEKLGNLKQSKKYVQGHLLNHNLGGEGRRFNLSPINKKANADHLAEIERQVKEEVNQNGTVMRYKVEAVYGSHPKPKPYEKLLEQQDKPKGLTKSEKERLAEYEAEQQLCTGFDYEARELKFEDGKWVDNKDAKLYSDHIDNTIDLTK